MSAPRSRKRRDPAASRAAGTPAAPASGGAPASRGTAEAESPRETMARGYARGRARDEAIRAGLEPLAPGERPWPVTAAAVLAALCGLANLVLLAAGYEVEGSSPATAVVVGLIFLVFAAGMWRVRYWAVLGFEGLLGVTMVGAMLALLLASNLAAVLSAVAVLAVTGPLFWLLIRQMARIQAPARPPVS